MAAGGDEELDRRRNSSLAGAIEVWNTRFGVRIDEASRDVLLLHLDRIPSDLMGFANDVFDLSPALSDFCAMCLDNARGDLYETAVMLGAPATDATAALLADPAHMIETRLVAAMVGTGTVALRFD